MFRTEIASSEIGWRDWIRTSISVVNSDASYLLSTRQKNWSEIRDSNSGTHEPKSCAVPSQLISGIKLGSGNRIRTCESFDTGL